MARQTKRLPVVLIPKLLFIASMWFDVVNALGWCYPALSFALSTQRIYLEPCFSCPIPCCCVPSLSCTSSPLVIRSLALSLVPCWVVAGWGFVGQWITLPWACTRRTSHLLLCADTLRMAGIPPIRTLGLLPLAGIDDKCHQRRNRCTPPPSVRTIRMSTASAALVLPSSFPPP